MALVESSVRFVLDGAVVEAEGVAATTTLLDYLRERQACTAVKEGCAEGDCGACTVAVGSLEGDGIHWQAVNSCIRFVPTLDGTEVVTAQGVDAEDGTLHPVQQAMVDCHGSQCGFCTPGFVMSLFAHYVNSDGVAPSRESVLTALSGNLCRCTGYRPIIDAGLRMADYPAPARWSVADAGAPERVARLRGMQRSHGLSLPGFKAPLSLEAFAREYEAHPDALILAGGTDIGLWVTKQLRQLPPMLYLGSVAELKTIAPVGDALEIGAAVSLEQAFSVLKTHYPQLEELSRRFASRPIRNSGTLCGNVANGSPIGDAMPALIALGATLCLRKGAARREIPLEDFYLGYQKKDLGPGEFVEKIRIPLSGGFTYFSLYKVSKRIDQDISAVCAGLAVTVSDGVVTAARLAYGGMAAVPKRAYHGEQALLGAPWNESAIDGAAAALAQDFTPLTDMRASSDYRQAVAANLLRRFWFECGQGGAARLESFGPVDVETGAMP